MDKWLYVLYKCYLGKNEGIRIDAIVQFVNDYNGREFFEKYSTPKDTILDFLQRLRKNRIDIESF